MQKVRTRLVNFRVTDEEFEQLKSACDRRGARCLSEFARTVMLTSADINAADDLANRLAELERRVSGVELSISRVVSIFSRLQATVNA